MTASPRARTARGASVVEYALVLALIVLVSLVGLRLLSAELGESLDRSQRSIVDAEPSPDPPGG
jgi:Flp pilus assembly pilin Flp